MASFKRNDRQTKIQLTLIWDMGEEAQCVCAYMCSIRMESQGHETACSLLVAVLLRFNSRISSYFIV